MTFNQTTKIIFLAHKVHVHHWPPETPKWSEHRKKQVDQELNKNKEKLRIEVRDKTILINKYEFSAIKKVGITIPFFKKQCTMIFEGHCQEFDAHIHITTKEKNYLEIFNKLMNWITESFPNNS